jgi:hypothetical protein
MAQIRDFSGGLSTRLHPSLISTTEAVTYKDIDNTGVCLAPIKSSLAELQNFGDNTGIYFFNGQWIARDYNTDYVEFQEKLYFSDGVGVPQKTSNGTTFHNLGIAAPSIKPILTYNGVIPTDAETDTMQYCYTYYNNSDGTESAPSPYSAELIVASQNVTVTGITSSTDPQVTHIKLYRLGNTKTEMSLVVTLSNTTQSYTDILSDVAIDGAILSSFNAGMAPSGLKFLTLHATMFFGVINDVLYYSDVAYVNNWSPFFFIDFESTIIGLGSTQNGLLVFTKDKTYIITGDSPMSLSKMLLHGNQGCLSHKTIKYADNSLLWLSRDGICTSNGAQIQIVTLDKLGILDLDPISAEVWNSEYYLFHDAGTLIIDYRFGKVTFKELSLIANGSWYSYQFDKLYYLDPNGYLYSLYNGTSVVPYHWKSGWITEDSISMVKSYNNFYIFTEGANQLKLYINGLLVASHELPEGASDVTVPVQLQLGYYLEVELTGTGKVLEIEYKVSGRANGR